MIIFSYDVGQKSLGFSIIQYIPPNDLIKKIKNNEYTISEIENYFETCVQILYMEVFDLSPGKKIKDSSLIDMTRNLVKILKNNDKLKWRPEKVLIEKQFQFKGNCSTMAQLIMYYSDLDIELVNPRAKNALYTVNVPAEAFADEKSKYSANKKRAVAIITDLFPESLAKIPKTKRKDCCDAALQAIAWIYG